MSSAAFEQKLEKVVSRYRELSTLLSGNMTSSSKFQDMSREYSDLTPTVEAIEKLRTVRAEIEDLKSMLADKSTQGEMRTMAQQELEVLKSQVPQLERTIQFSLIPKDKADSKNAIIEIRAGTGGQEAALFAEDLFSMYRGYAQQNGWRFEILEVSQTDLGGYKEAIATIAGQNVFEKLKFESGVHRVQRVPKTETQGRIHTSAATVAVLPEAEDVDVNIEEKDLRIEVFRASGPGGQSVNTTDSAVRITHVPTGVVVSQQDEKSQHKNKAKALRILRARVYDLERQKQEDARAATRKTQVGSGDRSERIRTYNFPQGRVTDHRINVTLYKLDKVITGECLNEIINPLVAEDRAAKLADMSW